MRTVPPKVLVLGLGNDILTDDAVGLHVVEAVRDRLGDEPEVEVRATTEMGLALLDEIIDREGLVLVDSVQTGRVPPGSLHEVGPEALREVFTPSPHFLGVGETLSLAGLLGLAMPRQIRIVAIEVADPFTLGTHLTSAVESAIEPAAARVLALAREFVGSAAIHQTPMPSSTRRQ
jgi:hydrogenase maturation protease